MEPNSYLRQTRPVCSIAKWSINRAVGKAMDLITKDYEYSEMELFADTETAQFSPWPIHEKFAFGRDLLPKLIRRLGVTRHDRQVSVLQNLRSLHHLLSDPELCLESLQLNVLKSLTFLLLVDTSETVKLWTLACLKVIAGNPQGIISILRKSFLLLQITSCFKLPNPSVNQMAFTVLNRLSQNWFGVPELQNFGCIQLVIETLFTLTGKENLHEDSIVCLLQTLANLMDHRNGTLVAIRYDVFDLKWLLHCGNSNIEFAALKIFAQIGKDEIGRIGLSRKKITEELLEAFSNDPLKLKGSACYNEEDYMNIEAEILQIATSPNELRAEHFRSGILTEIVQVFELPGLSNATRQALVKLLTNFAELPAGRAELRKHLSSFITQQLCDINLQKSVGTLIEKIVQQP